MSKNEEGLSLLEGGALIVERVVPKPGTFTLIMSDTMCSLGRPPISTFRRRLATRRRRRRARPRRHVR